MGVYDFFVGRLLCPHCGAISSASGTTNMQTKIREKPQMINLGVGDPVPLTVQSIAANDVFGYLPIRVPKENEPIRLLDQWECPACDAGYNWAEVVIDRGVIASVAAVPFDRAHFERSHLVSEGVIDEIQKRTDTPYSELFKAELVELLRKIL